MAIVIRGTAIAQGISFREFFDANRLHTYPPLFFDGINFSLYRFEINSTAIKEVARKRERKFLKLYEDIVGNCLLSLLEKNCIFFC